MNNTNLQLLYLDWKTPPSIVYLNNAKKYLHMLVINVTKMF